MTDFFQVFFIGCDEGGIVGSNCQDFIASINDLFFFLLLSRTPGDNRANASWGKSPIVKGLYL